MVNRSNHYNIKTWGRKYAPMFFITLMWLLPGVKSSAQNISKHYTSSQQENGTLYYIFPQEGFKSRKTKSSLVYDLTYLSGKESITINFSFFNSAIATIDSISFTTATGKVFCRPATKIFIEEKKSKWHYRYTADFLFADMKTIFKEQESPTIDIYTKQGKTSLTISNKNWSDQSAMTSKIFDLFMLNMNK